jgi:hypothetical protein
VSHSLLAGQSSTSSKSAQKGSPAALVVQRQVSPQKADPTVQTSFSAVQVSVVQAATGSQSSPGMQHWVKSGVEQYVRPCGQVHRNSSQAQPSAKHSGATGQQNSSQIRAVGVQTPSQVSVPTGQVQRPAVQVAPAVQSAEVQQALIEMHCPRQSFCPLAQPGAGGGPFFFFFFFLFFFLASAPVSPRSGVSTPPQARPPSSGANDRRERSLLRKRVMMSKQMLSMV